MEIINNNKRVIKTESEIKYEDSELSTTMIVIPAGYEVEVINVYDSGYSFISLEIGGITFKGFIVTDNLE